MLPGRILFPRSWSAHLALTAIPLLYVGVVLATHGLGGSSNGRELATLSLLAAASWALVYGLHRRQVRMLDALSRARQQTRAMLEQLTSSSHDGVWVMEGDGRLLYVNQRLRELIGWPGDGVGDGRDWLSQVHPDDRATFAASRRALALGVPQTLQYRLCLSDGVERWVEDRAHRVDDFSGPARLLGILIDITERKQADARIATLSRHVRILSHVNQAVLKSAHTGALYREIVDITTRYGNFAAAWVIVGADVPGRSRVAFSAGAPQRLLDELAAAGLPEAPLCRDDALWREMFFPDDFAPHVRRLDRGRLPMERLAARHFPAGAELVVFPLRQQGVVVATLTLVSPPEQPISEDALLMLYELSVDVSFALDLCARETERLQDGVDARLVHLAHHDALTGLPNRLLLRDRVEQALSQSRRVGGEGALFFLDLDNFKTVNDSLGHQVGDQLLIELAGRVQSCLRDSDTLSRLGGDEFVIVISGVNAREDIETVAAKILDAFSRPIRLAGQELMVAFSIGIARFPRDGDDFDTLLRHADTAMYDAKRAGKRTFRFFTPELNSSALENLQLQNAMYQALTLGEFHLAYQPQIDVRSSRIVGVEALARWSSPVNGEVPPQRFIPLAEESGFIIVLGDWVLDQACRQARAWLDDGMPPLQMAVNVAAQQIHSPGFAARVIALLEAHGLPPGTLLLEITEGSVVYEDQQVRQCITLLKGAGVQFAIDDFGTGYSNLGFLRRLNADKVKIDQSFVRAMNNGFDDAMLVQTIIQMARNLKLDAVAEGVETQEELAWLARMGCHQVQGYLASVPLPAAELTVLLQEGVTLGR